MLSRKRLSQSVELVSRRFRRLANYPALPNLHRIKFYDSYSKSYYSTNPKIWGFGLTNKKGKKILVNGNKLRSAPPYLRFQSIRLLPRHLIKEQLRECLRDFSHCFIGAELTISIDALCTPMEFQRFLAERILTIFPKSTFIITIHEIVTEDYNRPAYKTRLSALDKHLFSGCDSAQRTIGHSPLSNFLISVPSIMNCSFLKLYVHWGGEPLVTLDDVVQWLHYVPVEPTRNFRVFEWPAEETEEILPEEIYCKANRNMFLDNQLLERRVSDIDAEAAIKLVEQIKKRFLEAAAPDEKREFYLVLNAVSAMGPNFTFGLVKHLAEFDIQNSATKERLTV
ncbi:hypothetical protein Ddc_23400 [Ditylenchus destructor]|nr:hypothetical protein Ddc_23400 [Ditylenchus destructor]